MLSTYLIVIAVAAVIAFLLGRARGVALAAGGTRLHSLPSYHGLYVAAAAVIPMLVMLVVVVAPLLALQRVQAAMVDRQ